MTDVQEAEIRVPKLPHMPPEAVEFLRERLSRARCYLEYGSGGSTRLAVRQKVPYVFSVESDSNFAKAVRRFVSHEPRGTKFKIVVPNIGPTKKWGYPVDNESSTKWHSYVTQVWDSVEQAGVSPDLMLIDGRFRVASFLACLVKSQPGSTILFDDYIGRERRYAVVESIVKPKRLVARVAIFETPSDLDTAHVVMEMLRNANRVW